MKGCFLIVYFLLKISFSSEQGSGGDDVLALPSGGGRWTIPAGCTESCRFVEWVPVVRNGQPKLLFTVRGDQRGYVAVAISENKFMGDDDVYLCSRTSPSSSDIAIVSASLVRYQIPENNVPITAEDGSSSNLTSTFLTCTFERPYVVSKTIRDVFRTWNVATTNYHLLYAEGSVASNGRAKPHSLRLSTNSAYSLLDNTGYGQPSTPAGEEEGRSLNPSVPVNPQDNILALSPSGGSWLVDCPERGCKSVQWNPVTGSNGEPMLQFRIDGSGTDWVGMAISRDTSMGPDDDCYYCARPTPDSASIQVISAFLITRGPPASLGPVDSNNVIEAEIVDGALVCTFMRPLNVSKPTAIGPFNWDLSKENFNLFYAEGSVNTGGQLQQHTFRKSTNSKFNLLDNSGYKAEPAFPEVSTSGIPSILVPEDGVETNSGGGGVWTFPRGCQNDCHSFSWQPLVRNGAESMMLNITGNAEGYVGILFTDNVTTSTGDCYLCVKLNSNEVAVFSEACSNTALPTTTRPLLQEDIISASATNESIFCSFYRALNVTKNIGDEERNYDLTDAYFLVYAKGPLIQDTQNIGTVSYSAFTSFPVALFNRTTFQAEGGSELLTTPSSRNLETTSTVVDEIDQSSSTPRAGDQGTTPPTRTEPTTSGSAALWQFTTFISVVVSTATYALCYVLIDRFN